MSTTPYNLTGLPLRLVQIVCLLLIGLKLAHLSLAGTFMDEAYYWMWGQHPALSYYDHPPLNSWLTALSSTLFGWSRFALRLPIALTFLADIAAIYLIARRIGGGAWQGQFWLTLLLFLTTPIFWMISNFGLPDHVLVTGCLFAIYFFFRFFADRAAGQDGATRDLLLGGVFLGLAVLAKYNAVFLGLGVALFVLLWDRALLRQGRLYLAALIAVVIQTPVVVWNLTEGFASWRFIAGGRHGGLAASFDGVYSLVFGILVFVSPFLFWPIGKFVFSRKNSIPGDGFARSAFIVSTLSIVTVAFFTGTLFHWNLVAYAAMLPFLASNMRPRFLLMLQALYGIVFAVAVFINYAVTPIVPAEWRDESTAWSYGWEQTAIAAEAARLAHKADFIAASDYTTAALLGFAMRDRDVTSLSPKRDQFDFWFDPAAHAGQSAILFGDYFRSIGPIAPLFDSIEPLQSFDVVVNGRTIDSHQLYLAKGFKPNG